MTTQEIINQALTTLPEDSRQYVDKNLALTERVQALMDEKGWTQKELATLLDKRESEISRWLTGMHNFTLRSLTKLEVALGADIFTVPGTAHAQAQRYSFMYLTLPSHPEGVLGVVAIDSVPARQKSAGLETVTIGEESYALAA